MTCKDCKHYNKASYCICSKYMLPLDRDDKPCNYFSYNECVDSWADKILQKDDAKQLVEQLSHTPILDDEIHKAMIEDSWEEREQMSKEKAYEIVKHHGIGYTETDYDEALSIIRQSLGITEEIESPVIAIAGCGDFIRPNDCKSKGGCAIQAVPIEVLQEIRNEIETLNTTDSFDEIFKTIVLDIIDKHLENVSK